MTAPVSCPRCSSHRISQLGLRLWTCVCGKRWSVKKPVKPDPKLRDHLPLGVPGITARALFTKLNGFDPGAETNGVNASKMKTLRAQLYALQEAGLAKLNGNPRFPPMTWTQS